MTAALTFAQALLSCLEEALTEAGNPPGIISLRGGDHVSPSISVNGDECCSGIGWVRIVRTDVADLDLPSGVRGRCINHTRTTTLEMGVIRCMPTPDSGRMVTAEEWDDVVLQMEADHGSMEQALCCLTAVDSLGDPDYTALSYEPRGQDGNCIGGTLQLTVTYACACGSG